MDQECDQIDHLRLRVHGCQASAFLIRQAQSAPRLRDARASQSAGDVPDQRPTNRSRNQAYLTGQAEKTSAESWNMTAAQHARTHMTCIAADGQIHAEGVELTHIDAVSWMKASGRSGQ